MISFQVGILARRGAVVVAGSATHVECRCVIIAPTRYRLGSMHGIHADFEPGQRQLSSVIICRAFVSFGS